MENKRNSSRTAKRIAAAAISFMMAFGTGTSLVTSCIFSCSTITASAESTADIRLEKDTGTFTYGGNEYTYKVNVYRDGYKANKIHAIGLTSVTPHERAVSLPRYVELPGDNGKYVTYVINKLENGFGEGLRTENLYLPDTIEYIGDDVLKGADIHKLTMSSGLKIIGSNFGEGGKFFDISMNAPELRSVGEKCLKDNTYCNKFGDAVYFGNCLVSYTGDAKELAVKDLGEGKITTIANGAVADNKNIEKVDLSGIVNISSGAFYSCTNLKEVVNADDVVNVGIYAFWDTHWYHHVAVNDVEILGKCLIRYVVKDGVLDLTDKIFDDVENIDFLAIQGEDITTLKIKKSTKACFGYDVNKSKFKSVETVIIDGKELMPTNAYSCYPEYISDNYEIFNGSKFEEKYVKAKVKLLFEALGIKYFEPEERTYSGFTEKEQYEIVYKINNYLVRNYTYGDGSMCFGQAFCSNRTILCQQHAELAAHLLDCANIECEIAVEADFFDLEGNFLHHGELYGR